MTDTFGEGTKGLSLCVGMNYKALNQCICFDHRLSYCVMTTINRYEQLYIDTSDHVDKFNLFITSLTLGGVLDPKVRGPP